MEPEAVVARFVARNDFHTLLRFPGNSRPDPFAQIQELLPVTSLQRVATDLVRQKRLTATIQLFLPDSWGRYRPQPHRPERARFDAFGCSRESFAHRAANGWTILAAGSGWRFRISFKRVHRTALPRSRRDNHFCQIRVTW